MPITIEQVETTPVLYPVQGYFKFFENAAGRPLGRPAVLVRITASDGTVGWGESVPSPRWSYETLETVESTIRQYLAPELLGRDPLDDESLWSTLHRAIAPSFSTGQPICKAGIDLALFDLTGKLRRQSAAECWNRPAGDPVELSWTLNPRTVPEVEPLILQAAARGYRDFNLKVAPDPRADLVMVREIRRLAPRAVLWVDANGGYSLEDALWVAPQFAELGVAWFEQPVAANRLGWLARLKRQGALPIILDEGVVSTVELAEFHRLQLLDGVAIKVARAGGLAEARRQIEFLEQEGLIFLGSGLTDPDVSLAASLALFSACGLRHAAALNGPQYLTDSLLTRPFRTAAGQLAPPSGWGLGIEIDPAALERLRLTV